MTGDAITAAEAADWGLINRAVPDDELDAAVLDLITRATRGSAWSKAVGKRTFYDQQGLSLVSRGCLVDDIVYTIALTAIQAEQSAARRKSGAAKA